MDLIADSDTPTTYTTVGGLALVQEPSLSSAHCQTESEGTILLQLLEFKTHLLEVVEELHIQKDAEKRFEDQISKLVLDKQELEWEKESVQHQIETVANQHAETLSNVKNQLQAKIRNIEEEKGNYQVSVELKDKEINNLKEELRSLQLLKYNLEKKSNELEQKLALQSRSKDSHLNQLGEVEKRFSALSRQCAMVKQAHEKLEQNVDEAMRINMKLTSANETQEATIVALKKELGEVNNKLIKAKMTSVRHDKISHTGNEQHIQKLHQKLNMETEMNKKLHEENVAVRAEKKEVMRSLQQTQQLLLSQTQTLNRTELELQTQREQYQALKQEHQVMRDKRKPLDDKVAKLMETYAAFKTSWDKEKKIFLDCIKSEQQNLQTVKEAYNELRQKQTELSSVAKAQEQHISEIEIRNSNHSHGVSTQDFDHNGPMSSAELPGSGCLQPLASSQTKNPDCLEDAGEVTKLLATGTTGGQEALNHHQQFQFKQPLNPTNLFTLPLFTNNLFSPSSQSGTPSNNTHILNKYIKNYTTNEGDPDVVSDSRPDRRSINECGGLLSKEKNEEGNRRMNDRKHEEKDDGGQEKKNSKEEGRNTEQQWNREEVQVEDVRERGSTGEKRGTVTAQTKDTAERREDSQGSAEDVRDARNPETEKRERADGQGTDGTAHTSETPESQTLTQTTTDWNINKSNTQQVIDFLDTEAPLAECQPSDCSQSHSQKVIEEDPDSIHLNKGCGIGREGQLLNTLNSDHSQSVNHGHNPVIQVQSLCDDEVQTQDAETLSQLPSQRKVSEKTGGEEKPTDKSAADIPTDPSEPLSQSSRSSQTYTVPLAAQTDGIVGIQDLERTTSQTVTSNPTDITSNMKQTDKVCDINVTGECVIGTTRGEPQPLPQSQEILEQENEHLKSLVTDDDGGDSSAYRKSRGQPRQDTQENYDCKTLQDPKEKSKLKDVCVDIIMDTVDLESEVESGSCQDHMKNDKIENTRDAKATKRETDLKASVRLSGPRSSFDLVSVLHQSVQGYEQNTSGSGGRLRHPPSTKPMFGKSKLRKVPLVITRASDQLNASSVSGNAASSTRHRQGESRALADTCRETTAADMESRDSLSISCFPVSAFSSAVNILSLQATPGCSTAPASTAGCTSESEWEPYCSQEGEDQQPSFRAQICKIEQFLNEEGLCLPKRRRTDN